jgi:hypothetical protein
VGLWLGRRFTREPLDWIETAATWEMHPNPAQQPEAKVFPGAYKCHYKHELVVNHHESVDSTLPHR